MKESDIPVEMFRGMSFLYHACMNGGKTKKLSDSMERVWHSHFNGRVYNHVNNKRERDGIRVNGKGELIPGKTVNSVDEIVEDIEMIEQIIFSNKRRDRRKDPFAYVQTRIYEGEVREDRFLRKTPLLAVGMDEINFFCHKADDAKKMISFIEWVKKKGLILYAAGLLNDFRGNPFGHVYSVFPHFDVTIDCKPVCKRIVDNKPCGNSAHHTQKLWSIEMVPEELSEYTQELDYFDFATKENEVVINKYIAAPYFSPTIESEEEDENGRNMSRYVPVCHSCKDLPFKEETFKVYDAIVEDRSIRNLGVPKEIKDAILAFLCHEDEKWVQKIGEEYRAIPRYRNQIGSYQAHI